MTSLTKISVSFTAIVPHDLAALLDGQVLEALVQSVIAGHLPAKIQATLADNSATLAEVHQAVRKLYLAKMANDVARMAQAREQLAEIPLDEDGRLEADFIVWPAGTPWSEVDAWFKAN